MIFFPARGRKINEILIKTSEIFKIFFKKVKIFLENEKVGLLDEPSYSNEKVGQRINLLTWREFGPLDQPSYSNEQVGPLDQSSLSNEKVGPRDQSSHSLGVIPRGFLKLFTNF